MVNTSNRSQLKLRLSYNAVFQGLRRTMKIAMTIVAVISCYCWGTFAWFTGGLLLSEELPTLATLTNCIYGAALLAPFIRARLTRFSTTQLLVGLSGLSALGLVAMMNPSWLPAGYLTVGILRLFLMPVMLGFCEPNLGAVGAVVLLNGGFSAANAVLKPIIAILVAAGTWRLGLAAGIVLIAVSAVSAVLATARGEAAEAAPSANGQNARRLGGMIIVLLAIQLSYGIREVAVYRVAERMFGDTTWAGKLEAIVETAMLVGVFLTPLLRTSMVIPMLVAQSATNLFMVAAIQSHNVQLLYAAQTLEGLSYAVLERLSEVTYLQQLGGMPNAGIAYQWIDSLTRVFPMPSRLLASSNITLEAIYGVMAIAALLILVLYRSAIAEWVGNRLFAVAGVTTHRRRSLRVRIISVIFIVQIKFSRQELPPVAEPQAQRKVLPTEVEQLLSPRIR